MIFGAIGLALVLVFALVEYYYTKLKKINGVFNFENAVSNISVGIFERTLYLLLAPFIYSVFEYIYTEFSVMSISFNFFSFVLLLMITDLVWYWYHRFGHEINIFWAAHIVHHSSQDYNFTTAARITIIQGLVRSVFWCLLPAIGFKPEMVMSVLVFHGAYAFFTHTRTIGKLGILEKIFITPSLHRVHHASNEKYLDKNYGDVFVFWDKLFGTFQEEEEEPTYGLTHPLKSHSFLWIHFHYYLELIAYAKTKRTFKEKLFVFIGPPTNMNPAIRVALERKWLKNNDRNPAPILKPYVILQILTCFSILIYLIFYIEELSGLYNLLAIGTIFFTLIIAGAILEQKKWVFYIEAIRLQFILGLLSIIHEEYLLLPLMLFIQITASVCLNWKDWYLKTVLKT